MRLPNSQFPVEVSSSISSNSCGIAMNAKVFHALSSGQYQNKIGSVVREISCNAYDSHVDNGNVDEPFEIHLPDAFEPYWSVRDYGTGLTPEIIDTVYRNYFVSTKDDCNNKIGAFGLGSKTPLCYTDQFTLTSVTDGVMRAYSVYFDEDGLTRIDLMAEMPTDERQGVEIKVGVRPEDFHTFADEVREQLRFFKVKPTFTTILLLPSIRFEYQTTSRTPLTAVSSRL
jgi:hypothetical protein